MLDWGLEIIGIVVRFLLVITKINITKINIQDVFLIVYIYSRY